MTKHVEAKSIMVYDVTGNLIVAQDFNEGKLKLSSMLNQNNPYIEGCGKPLIGCDVWEHAYYLKYQNDREKYLKNWVKLINWNFVNETLESYN